MCKVLIPPYIKPQFYTGFKHRNRVKEPPSPYLVSYLNSYIVSATESVPSAVAVTVDYGSRENYPAGHTDCLGARASH